MAGNHRKSRLFGHPKGTQKTEIQSASDRDSDILWGKPIGFWHLLNRIDFIFCTARKIGTTGKNYGIPNPFSLPLPCCFRWQK